MVNQDFVKVLTNVLQGGMDKNKFEWCILNNDHKLKLIYDDLAEQITQQSEYMQKAFHILYCVVHRKQMAKGYEPASISYPNA